MPLAPAGLACARKLVGPACFRGHRKHCAAADPAALRQPDTHELLAMMQGEVAPSSYKLVRQTWQTQAGTSDFEGWWRKALHDGVIANTAARPLTGQTPKRPDIAAKTVPQGMSLLFAPDASAWDGAFANNAWLQECPHPFTKDVWGNAVHVSPEDARHIGLEDDDLLTVEHGGRSLQAPVRIRAGQAAGIVAVSLGY